MAGALVLLLAAPVFFLSVLYFFGDNYFEVQKFYCEESECYSLPVHTTKLTVYFIEKDSDYENRLKSLFQDKIVCVKNLSNENLHDLKVEAYTDNLVTSILVDSQGIIRGYYNLTNSDEKERLITEIQILQENTK